MMKIDQYLKSKFFPIKEVDIRTNYPTSYKIYVAGEEIGSFVSSKEPKSVKELIGVKMMLMDKALKRQGELYCLMFKTKIKKVTYYVLSVIRIK